LGEVERLLDGRPELARNELSSWAEGVLMMPAKARNRPMVELLLRFGAQVPALSKWGRFYYFRHDDIAALLLENRMSPGHMTWQQVTLLHDMAHSGDIAKARLLLGHGAQINAIDDQYRTTPLGLAARSGHREMVGFLIERGLGYHSSGTDTTRPSSSSTMRGSRTAKFDTSVRVKWVMPQDCSLNYSLRWASDWSRG
jgi:uncharacterized protein